MKVHRVTAYVIDFDGLGAYSVREEIDRIRYPNDCILPRVLSVETWDVGEWDDGHPLNRRDAYKKYREELFATPPESTIRGDE